MDIIEIDEFDGIPEEGAIAKETPIEEKPVEQPTTEQPTVESNTTQVTQLSEPGSLKIDRDSLPMSTLKASLVLVGSNEKDYGLIEDVLFDPAWEPGKGEVVGTWNRLPDSGLSTSGLIRLELTTSIQAMNDRAVIIMKQILDGEKSGKIKKVRQLPAKKPKSQLKLAPIPEPPSEPSIVEGFDSLRARLAAMKSGKAADIPKPETAITSQEPVPSQSQDNMNNMSNINNIMEDQTNNNGQ